MESVLLVLLALATGLCTPVQSAANSKLAKVGTGTPVLAAAVNTAVGTLNLLVIAGVLHLAGWLPLQPQGGLARVPWWGWCGGLLGSLYVLSLVFLFPRLGAGVSIGLVVCAQLVASLVLDQFGWLGLEKRPVDWSRLGGVVLIAGGAILLLWRR
jgi:transporter family-2 protein